MRVLAVHRDITDRVEAMEQPRDSEIRNRLLLDSAPDAIWILTSSHRCEYVHEAACKLFQRTREELVGHHVAEFLAEGGGEAVEAAMQQVRESGTADVVTQAQRRDGSLIPVEIHTVDLGNGTYQSVARDVSIWLDKERAREASEARYRRALDRATEGI
ncbi:MAG: PAS domain S-box protein, partial [Dehalococcoidia bacterium]